VTLCRLGGTIVYRLCVYVCASVCVVCFSLCATCHHPTPPPQHTQDSLKTAVMGKDTGLSEAHLSASKVLSDTPAVQVSKGLRCSPRRMWIGSLVAHK
jgi:hypothetical protein